MQLRTSGSRKQLMLSIIHNIYTISAQYYKLHVTHIILLLLILGLEKGLFSTGHIFFEC